MTNKKLYNFYKGMSLTIDGPPIYYYFNKSKISFVEFVNVEGEAILRETKEHHFLFKIYDTYLIGDTIIGLN
jgi:hypothetical protein